MLKQRKAKEKVLGSSSSDEFEDTFERDGDDSSDEESVKEAYSKYELTNRYKDFLENQPDELKKIDPRGYSFIAYAIGVKILYSPQVNRYYYPKKEKLGTCELECSEETIYEWLEKSTTDTIQKSFLIKKNSKEAKAIQRFFLKFITENSQYIEEFIQDLFKRKRYLFKQRHSNSLLPPLADCLEPLYEKIHTFIDEIADTFFYEMRATFTISGLARNHKLQGQVKGEVRDYLVDNELINGGKPIGKKDRKNLIDAIKEDASWVDKKILKALKKLNANKLIENFLNENAYTFCHYKIAESIEAELETDPSIIAKDHEHYYFLPGIEVEGSNFEWLFEANENCMAAYLAINVNAMREMLHSNVTRENFSCGFVHFLKENERQLPIEIFRPVLSEQTCFKSKNIWEYLANLRLAYRDQLRQIRQAQEEGEKIAGAKFQRAWQFGAIKYLALEAQEITVNGGRKDLVINLANYENIYLELREKTSLISNILTEAGEKPIHVKDSAHWILAILMHDSEKVLTTQEGEKIQLRRRDEEKILKFLINLTYLIFGCEVARNPSALIIHVMMLQLIANNQLSWQGALNKKVKTGQGTVTHHTRHIQYGGGEMPMSMGSYEEEHTGEDKKTKKKRGEPVLCARMLQDHYGTFAIKSYRYPGNRLPDSDEAQGKINELAKREKSLVNKWLIAVKKSDHNIKKEIQAIEEIFSHPYNFK